MAHGGEDDEDDGADHDEGHQEEVRVRLQPVGEALVLCDLITVAF